MATPDFLHPILPSDDRIRRILLYGPPPGRLSPLPVPHSRRLNLPPEQRAIIERNFAWQTFTRPSRSWSWEKTEQYVHYKDVLTVAYLYDYPARDWVTCAEAARFAVEALLAREAMRRLGVSVFAMDTPFSWWMSGVVPPELREEIDEDMRVELEEEAKEVEDSMEVKHEPVTPETLLPPFNISETEPSITSEKEILEDAAEEERAIEEDPGVNPSPRRSARVSERKPKGDDWDQQVKEELVEETTEPDARSPPTMRTSTALNGTEAKKIVQIKHEEEEDLPRRSTRVAPKRKFADEPWS